MEAGKSTSHFVFDFGLRHRIRRKPTKADIDLEDAFASCLDEARTPGRSPSCVSNRL
jgi:hypothetical protein